MFWFLLRHVCWRAWCWFMRTFVTCWWAGSIHTIVVHRRPHIDELASADLLQSDYGARVYAGIQYARIIFYDRSVHEDGRSEADWLADGYLFVGVRGGELDDHPHGAHPDNCTFTMVLSRLGVRDEPLFAQIAQEVFKEDRFAGEGPLHLAPSLKRMHAAGFPFSVIYAFVCMQMQAYRRSQALYQKAIAFWEAHWREHFVSVHNPHTDEELHLCVVEAQPDNPLLATAARNWTDTRPPADLYIQHHPDGGMQIFGNKWRGVVDLAELVANLRYAQAQLSGVQVADDVNWEGEGTMDEVPHLHFQLLAAAVFNRSLTATDVPRLEVPLHLVVDIARMFLGSYTGKIYRYRPRNRIAI